MKESYKFKRLRHTLGSDGLQCFGNVGKNEPKKVIGMPGILSGRESNLGILTCDSSFLLGYVCTISDLIKGL